MPLHLIASGNRAPHRPGKRRCIHRLPHDAFVAELRDFNGTPEAVLHDREFMELYLTLLRADFQAGSTPRFDGSLITEVRVVRDLRGNKRTIEEVWGASEPTSVYVARGLR